MCELPSDEQAAEKKRRAEVAAEKKKTEMRERAMDEMQNILKLMAWISETGGETKRVGGVIEGSWNNATLDVRPDGARWTARCISTGPLRVAHRNDAATPFDAAVGAVSKVAMWMRQKITEASEIEDSLLAKVAAAQEPQ